MTELMYRLQLTTEYVCIQWPMSVCLPPHHKFNILFDQCYRRMESLAVKSCLVLQFQHVVLMIQLNWKSSVVQNAILQVYIMISYY